MSGGKLAGTLRLPLVVRAPIVLRGVTFAGPVVGLSTSFDDLVDFGGSTFKKGADFTGASFGGPAVFADLHCEGKAQFTLASFHGSAFFGHAVFGRGASFERVSFAGESRFRGASFGKLADFDSASFADTADFGVASFGKDASFNGAEFRSTADFSGGEFAGRALFVAARFGQFADFIGRTFGPDTAAPARFSKSRFDGGASFLNSEFDGIVSFDLVQATGDMAFDGADFENLLSFSTARLLGATTFSQTDLRGLVDFEQAVISNLDLDGARLHRSVVIQLPAAKQTTGHVDELRFDPSDVGYFGAGSSARSEQERALALVEAAAKRGGDSSAENRAHEELATLQRRDDSAFVAALDWLFFWGVAGYFVLPLHQVVTLAVLVLTAALLRILYRHRRHAQPITYPASVRRSLGALWRLKIHEGTALAQTEATIYKLVVVVLLLNLVHGWTEIHDLVEGLL